MEVRRIGTVEPQVFRTTDLAGLGPSYAFAIVVHAPSKDDVRYGRHGMMLDALFHPHDNAPDVVYVFSSPTRPLEHVDGRHRHQVDPDGASTIQARFGDFAVVILDSSGHILASWTAPVDDRRAIHRVVGHTVGRSSRPPPRPGPRAD